MTTQLLSPATARLLNRIARARRVPFRAMALVQARDVGLPVALQMLITPGTAAHADTVAHKLFGNGFVPGTAATLDADADADADDLDRVAPACVTLAECDPLVGEGPACADRLCPAHVGVQLALYRVLTHDFIKMGRVLKEAALALNLAATVLQQAWSHPRP